MYLGLLSGNALGIVESTISKDTVLCSTSSNLTRGKLSKHDVRNAARTVGDISMNLNECIHSMKKEEKNEMREERRLSSDNLPLTSMDQTLNISAVFIARF